LVPPVEGSTVRAEHAAPRPAAAGTAPSARGTARYQWRAWGDLPASRALLAGLGGEPRLEQRRDVYLLGTRPTHNVKVRQRRLEVNLLLGEVAGFQLWTRAALHPLPGAAVILQRALTTALEEGATGTPLEEGATGTPLEEGATGTPLEERPAGAPLDEARFAALTGVGDEPDRLGRRKLLEDAVRRGLLPVAVNKERVRFRLGAERAEVTTVTIEEPAVQLSCVAIEGRDLRRLADLRRRLGLEGTANLSVPVALDEALRSARPF
jgi:hypothetical protein